MDAQRSAPRTTERFKLDACDLLAGGLEQDREFERGISRSVDEFIERELMQQHLRARYGFLKRCERATETYRQTSTRPFPRLAKLRPI